MTTDLPARRFSRRDAAMVAAGLIIALVACSLWSGFSNEGEETSTELEQTSAAPKVSIDELMVGPDVLKAASIELATVMLRPRVERVRASGTVEPNELHIQDVTPLVSGRVEQLSVVEGSAVRTGTVLLTMSSPEVAELQGTLRVAEARLAEADATLSRTRRIVELGAGSGKDSIAAESAQRATQAEVAQLRQRLAALGASAGSGSAAVASTTSVRAPSSATVIERLVNPGQWIEAGKAVIKLANLSTVWVVVNLPEARLPAVQVGAPVEIRVVALDNAVIAGRVSYIESQLDRETRTVLVRVEVPNPGHHLRIGMFVEVAIEGQRTGGDQLTIPSTAVQRIGERTVVFVPLEEAGRFQTRDVELGGESEGARIVLTGLRAGERVVSNGGFTLKSQLLKGQFGEDEELGRQGSLMVAALIRFAIAQRLLVMLLVVMMAAAGVASLSELPLDAVPDVTNVQVQILTSTPALAATEVERQITFPVEIAMTGLPGIAELRSVSMFGLSAVTVVFTDDTDIYAARHLVLERLSQARDEIPASVGTPEMGPIATGLGEIYQYELRATPGSGFDLATLRTMQDWDVRRQLLSVPGITEVNSFGGIEQQFQVLVNPERLQVYDLSLREVYDAVTRNNANVGGGYIEHGPEQYVLRSIGLAASTDDLRRIVVKTGKNGAPVYVRDLGDVVAGGALRQGAVTAQGNGEIVAGIAIMLVGENSRSVVQRVRARIDEIKRTLPKGVELVPFYDRTELVDRTIATVRRNLIEGAILVIVVLILLLGHWRGALLVATIIPLSMLFAAILMRVFNVSGNLMSLGALDFGLIVDGAVVMVENSVRRRVEAQRDNPREAPTDTILDACLEVGRPVAFAIAIIAIVYLPLLSLTGIEGKMFRPMAQTLVFALLGSLILSLTFVPAALTFVLRGPVSETESPVIRIMKRRYRPAFQYVRQRRLGATVVALVLLAGSVATFPFLGAEFIPRLDEGALVMEARLLPSASLTESIRVYSAAERTLRQFPEVTNVVSKIGRAEVATDPVGVDAADVFIALKPPEQWTSASTREELIEKMSEALERGAPEGAFSFSQPIEMRMSELISGVRSDIAIKLFGDDLETLRRTAQRIAEVVGRVGGAQDVKVEQVAGLPQLQITPNREAIARYGANIEDVNDLVEAISAGKDAGLVYRGEQRFGLTVKFDDTASRSEEAIRNLVLDTPSGARVPLSELATIELVEGPAQISREDTRRRIAIEMNVRGRDIGSFVKEAHQRLASQVTLPPGYYVTWGGQFENLQRASGRLLIVVPVALFLIFILLVSEFGSVGDALIVYMGVPFAVVGGVLALAARGLPLSISAVVGFIALSGVAVLNGVVMVSYINELRQQGRSLNEAVTVGAETRLRPVLMTALVASLGFLPMALATSAGAEVQRPLATVVIGGLITATVLTLLLLPTLYQWFDREATSP